MAPTQEGSGFDDDNTDVEAEAVVDRSVHVEVRTVIFFDECAVRSAEGLILPILIESAMLDQLLVDSALCDAHGG